MKSNRVSIKAVAERAGVSPATVSRVLNDKRNVSSDIVERVREAAKALNYHANEFARGLVKGRTSTVGVIVPDIDNTFFSRICKAIQNTVKSTGAAVFLHNTEGLIEMERKAMRELASKLINRMFLVAPRMPAPEIRALADELGIRVVVVDAKVENCRLSAVWVDNVTAFIEATEHLILQGHQRIAFVAGPLSVANSRDRLEGYGVALQRHALEVDASIISEGDFTIAGGYRAVEHIFESAAIPPTGIVCSNDLMAVGALLYFRESGIQVPNEISVVGCDDIDVARALSPPLTTIVQPIHELGVRAAQLLSQYIETNDRPPNSILHAKLVVRQSTSQRP